MEKRAERYMEDNLDIPVRLALEMIQRRIMEETAYLGIKTLKNPLDFWVYQEIVFQTRPDFIIEIGNYHGGSTLALAHICDHLENGRVIGLDLSHENVSPRVSGHPRILLIEGDACESFPKVAQIVGGHAKVMIIEDSAHTCENTLSVLETYSALVKPGQYFIVEDSICHHGLDTGPSPGPYEAIEAFLKKHPDFESDRKKESFFITWNPRGYLKRQAPDGKRRST